MLATIAVPTVMMSLRFCLKIQLLVICEYYKKGCKMGQLLVICQGKNVKK